MQPECASFPPNPSTCSVQLTCDLFILFACACFSLHSLSGVVCSMVWVVLPQPLKTQNSNEELSDSCLDWAFGVCKSQVSIWGAAAPGPHTAFHGPGLRMWNGSRMDRGILCLLSGHSSQCGDEARDRNKKETKQSGLGQHTQRTLETSKLLWLVLKFSCLALAWVHQNVLLPLDTLAFRSRKVLLKTGWGISRFTQLLTRLHDNFGNLR